MKSTLVNEQAMDALERCLVALQGEAVALIDTHWQKVMEGEKKAESWEDKSRLQVSCYRQGNHLQIKWIGIKWYGGKGARKSAKVSIPRSAGDLTYSPVKLKEWARPWEIELVENTEAQLASIRKRAYHIVRAIMAVRNADRIEKKLSPLTEESVPELVEE